MYRKRYSDFGHLPGNVPYCPVRLLKSYPIARNLDPSFSFLIGFGLTFAATAAPILVAEIAYPAYRSPLTSAYNSLWYSGAIVYVFIFKRMYQLILIDLHTVQLGLPLVPLKSKLLGHGVFPQFSNVYHLSSRWLLSGLDPNLLVG